MCPGWAVIAVDFPLVVHNVVALTIVRLRVFDKDSKIVYSLKYTRSCFFRYTMMTSSNGNTFRVTVPLCGEFIGHRWKLSQRPMTQSFDISFDLCLNKCLSKQSRRRWFERPSRSLWHQYNDAKMKKKIYATYSKQAPILSNMKSEQYIKALPKAWDIVMFCIYFIFFNLMIYEYKKYLILA